MLARLDILNTRTTWSWVAKSGRSIDVGGGRFRTGSGILRA